MDKQQTNASMAVIEDARKCLDILSNDESQQTIKLLANELRHAFLENGRVYLTGIGKPGYVAQKAAATLKSVRVNAEFLDATLAGHGDLGSMPIDEPSVLFALSKSGGSEELYKLFIAVKALRPKCRVVMICMSTDEQLPRVSSCKNIDYIARFALEPGELDGYGIVPATSNAMFEIILDSAIMTAAQSTIGLTGLCERLKQSHPFGTLYSKVTKLLDELNGAEPTLFDND